jgi:hypothetical protein
MNLFAKFLQLFPGHKGNTVEHRGEGTEDGLLLTLDVAQIALNEIANYLTDVPHSGLPHPANPNRFYTPRQALNIALTAQDVPTRISPNPNVIYGLLPSLRAVYSNGEVFWNGIAYKPTRAVAKLMDPLSSGDRQVKGRKLTFARDPRDLSRLFWQQPGTTAWHVLRGRYTNGRDVVAMSDILWARYLKYDGQVRSRKTKQMRERSHLYDFFTDLAKSKAGRTELRREFHRWLSRVEDPLAGPGMPSELESADAADFSFGLETGPFPPEDDDHDLLAIGDLDYDEPDEDY